MWVRVLAEIYISQMVKTLLLCFYTLLLFIAHFAETKQPSGTLHNKMARRQGQVADSKIEHRNRRQTEPVPPRYSRTRKLILITWRDRPRNPPSLVGGPAAEIKNRKVNATFCFTRHLSGSKSKLLKVHCFKRLGGQWAVWSILYRGWELPSYSCSDAIWWQSDGMDADGWWTMTSARLDWTFFIHFVRCRRVWNTETLRQDNDNGLFFGMRSYRKLFIVLAS